ncbi:hypothetical protein BH11PLA2_BH11PLA2_46050 [soil metagenome]
MSDDADRLASPGLLRWAAEAVLLFLIVLAPWPFGSVEVWWESFLFAGITVLTLLWLAYALIMGRLSIRPDAVSACLLGFLLLSAIQLIPLPQTVISIFSSTRVQLHRDLLPAQTELLPNESTASTNPKDSWLTLTVDPNLTREFLARVLAMLLLYTVVRTWLSSRETLRRVAWVTAANCVLLALLGFSQLFSSPSNTVYWSYQIPLATVFGPFVNRNHYPDYVLFGLGLGLAILMTRKEPKKAKFRGVEYTTSTISKLTDSPDLFVLGLGMIMLAISIPFTLSRGGLLAAITATVFIALTIWQTRGRMTRGLAYGAMFGVMALLFGGWFGWSSVADRISTLGKGEAALTRTEIWRDASRSIPSFFIFGSGNGTSKRIGNINRSGANAANQVIDLVHNEYLEAIIEGGIVRLVLTLAIAFISIRTGLRAYVRLKDRSTGPLVLGALFGVVALAVHSVVDYGIHIPAVTFLFTVMLGFLSNAATDPNYIPVRKGSGATPPASDPGRYTLRGPTSIMVSVGIAASALWLTWDASNRGLAYAYQIAARDAVRYSVPDLYRLRVESLTAATAATPGNGDLWARLAEAHFDFARDERRTATMALLGPSVILSQPLDAFNGTQGDQVRAGLIAARTARNLSPLMAQPHLFLAQYNAAFQQKESPRVLLERATRCAPTDPELYVLRGAEAASRRDFKTAFTDWQKAMTLASTTVSPVLRLARRYLEPQQILTELLPAEPLALLTAADQMYPAWSNADPALRRAYLLQIVSLDGKGGWTAQGWDSLARAHWELNHAEPAFAAWTQAVTQDPKDASIRDRFARFLELDERYDAAEAQLNWLRENNAGVDTTLRIEAVRHARELQRIIDGR